MAAYTLALHFIRREIRNRYLGSFSGGLWALFQPLLQLAVYGFVFGYVFKQRGTGGNSPGYVPVLVMGLWPWNAFAESLSHATTSIQSNAALIGKVALPREILVFSAVSATFLLQAIGFCAIATVLRLFGVPIHMLALPLALLVFAQLFLFALGVGLIFAAVQVFVRDLSTALPQILMMWMFCSPVLYSPQVLPKRVQSWLDWNPITHYTESFRAILLGYGNVTMAGTLASLALAIGLLAIGYRVFRRLNPHFEDFL